MTQRPGISSKGERDYTTTKKRSCEIKSKSVTVDESDGTFKEIKKALTTVTSKSRSTPILAQVAPIKG